MFFVCIVRRHQTERQIRENNSSYLTIIKTLRNLEVDFVVRNEDGYTQYIQVAYTVRGQKTLERELAPFNKIPDFNERLLITMVFYIEL